MLVFEIQAGDDFAVKRIGLEWQGVNDPIHNPEPSRGEKIVAASAPIKETMTVPATFSADHEGLRPQSLRLQAFAEDYLSKRERSYSPYLVLHVLTPAEHFKWMTEQMSQWAGAAQEVYDKELQLNEINKESRDLPPEALDDPAQRKKIQKQAAAEMANAAPYEGWKWQDHTAEEEYAQGVATNPRWRIAEEIGMMPKQSKIDNYRKKRTGDAAVVERGNRQPRNVRRDAGGAELRARVEREGFATWV